MYACILELYNKFYNYITATIRPQKVDPEQNGKKTGLNRISVYKTVVKNDNATFGLKKGHETVKY